MVIPAYNEADRLPTYLSEVTAYLRRELGEAWEVLVVDDGSRDDTAKLAATVLGESCVIRLPRNAGKGAAVREGMLRARGRYCLFTDADGSTPIAEERKLRHLLEDGAGVAIGSRAKGGTRRYLKLRTGDEPETAAPLWTVRAHRHFLGRVFSLFIRSLVGLPYRDTQCGFKMFRASIVKPLWSELRTSGFAFDVEVLLRAKEMNLMVEEIGVRWSEKAGSKVNVATDSVRMLTEVLAMRWRRTAGGLAQAFSFLMPAARKKS